MTDEQPPSSFCEEPVAAPQEGEWKDKYLRLLAEQENVRKRVLREKQEMLNFGVEDAISEFLPAIDQLEHALRYADQASVEIKNWALGFTMILAQLKEVLQHHGVVAILTEGVQFDPRLHEAVETEENRALPNGQIIQEFSRGYKSATRTLRPARVKVVRWPQEEVQEQELQNEGE